MDYSWIGMTRAQMSDDTMMRSTSLLKWTHNKQHKSATNGSSPWIHPPGALQGAHVVYLVKFLGCTEVEQAKGIEIVKAGIQKMRFSTHLKRSEGSKIPKVELTISVDGVAIQDPKTKRILYQYPLYRISYCADDKAEKRFFCFIAKEENAVEHRCFVFVSDRLAENITLTIGQAFDLAYRRFLETSGRELEMRKQILILQKRAKLLERDNMDLKNRVAELELGTLHQQHPDEVRLSLHGQADHRNPTAPSLMGSYSLPEDRTPLKQNGISDVFYLSAKDIHSVNFSGLNTDDLLKRLEPPPIPPRPANATSPPPELNARKTDLITLDPFAISITAEDDPFGDFQKLFSNGNRSMSAIETNRQFDEAIGKVDKRINDMKEGFGRGLSIENGDFTLESFDPLSNSSSA